MTTQPDNASRSADNNTVGEPLTTDTAAHAGDDTATPTGRKDQELPEGVTVAARTAHYRSDTASIVGAAGKNFIETVLTPDDM
ncbi:hypothetical protein ACFRJ1_02705 [Streptomyces sp. NPDC056773]|uniref:hypothetical protein n=1 Tax=unclassified Streptomyces TaxID=2593676 RepID=UPI0036A2ED3D